MGAVDDVGAVRVHADRRAELAGNALGADEGRPDGPEWRHAGRVLWILGADVEVPAPADLRARLAARAAAVVALYS